jgi:hypothetical protein
MTEHRIALRFDDFGWDALSEHADEEGWELGELVAIACAYYARSLDANGRIELAAPDWKPPERGEVREIAVEVDDAQWGALHRESDRQGVAIEALVAHASLLYLADVDAGRATERLLGDDLPADDDS